MKRILLTSIFSFLFLFVSAQDKLAFKYDTAGNQTSRQRICVNCTPTLKAVIPSSDSIPLIAEEPDKVLNEFKLITYPNPVTDELYVEWIKNPDKVISRIQLSSFDNRILFKMAIKENQAEQVIDFSNYAVGMYILVVYYTNETKQSFKIIKK